MEKNKVKKYVVIENFHLNFNNRGNSALCYGAVSFLEQYHNLKGYTLLNFHRYNKFWKRENLQHTIERLDIQGKEYVHEIIPVQNWEYNLYIKYHVRLPFTLFGKSIKKIDYLASDYGGDGFSDIYGKKAFINRMRDTFIAMEAGIPLIVLPQTLGPFKDICLAKTAEKVLRYASKVYARDNRFDADMKRMGIEYELTNDLSAFMQPEPWNIKIDKENAIGINVSGLAYSGGWCELKGQFEFYPLLIDKIIETFKEEGKTIYLIPHSYNYNVPETDNDDMVACKAVYEKWKDKADIVFVDKDLTAPQVKYVISNMSFFCGTRMHANYAAIFTKTPVFGLAYSYKFEGAFNNNGLYGQTVMINNITEKDVDVIVNQIIGIYKRYNP